VLIWVFPPPVCRTELFKLHNQHSLKKPPCRVPLTATVKMAANRLAWEESGNDDHFFARLRPPFILNPIF
jgi:hypothetical protein